MIHIYDLKEDQVEKLYQEWQLTHDEAEFESEKHLKNSFILFVKNNGYRFKETRGKPYKPADKPKGKNIFYEIYQDLKNEEELKKPNP